MIFQHKVGDLVTCELRSGIYQIVSLIEFKNGDGDDWKGPHYYYRKVFDKDYNLKICKAELAHEIWLRPLSLKRKEKLGEKINCPELKNTILDPKFSYWSITGFACKKDDKKIILSYFEPYLSTITKKQVDQILQKLEKDKLISLVGYVRNIKTYISKDQEFYRLEFGAYENDFRDPYDMSTQFFRTVRLKKINL